MKPISTHVLQQLRWGLACMTTAGLVACGGGGSTVTAVPQSISSLSVSAAQVVGGTANLTASATSGLTTFTYGTTSAGVCSVSNAVVSFNSAGTCAITVTQAGNANISATSATFNFTVSAAAQSPAPTPQAVTFSTGFASYTGGTGLTVEGGQFGGYGGSNLDNWYHACDGSDSGWCGSGANVVSGSLIAPNTSAYVYYQTPSPANTGQYSGMYIMAPGVTALRSNADTTGVTVASTYKMVFRFNQNPEWYNSTNNKFAVLLTLGKYYNTGTVNAPMACHITLKQVVTPTSLNAIFYSLPISAFSVKEPCGTGITTAAAALAASSSVVQVDFQADGGSAAITANGLTSGANSNVLSGSVYPSTVALSGGVTFAP